MWHLRDANRPCSDVSPVHSCTGLFRLKNKPIGICFSGLAGPYGAIYAHPISLPLHCASRHSSPCSAVFVPLGQAIV